MIALFVYAESPTRARVDRIHYKPELLSDEKKAGAYLVDTIPVAESMPRKAGILYLNPETMELWYEYVDRPLTTEENLSDMMAKIKGVEQLVIHSYPSWKAGNAGNAGDVVLYNHLLWEVIQAHTFQADWTPDAVPALFKKRSPDEEIPEWTQPLGAHDAYPIHAKVVHSGKLWISLYAANVWEPGVFGWEQVW